MRCGLRRDIQSLALCLTYQSDALGGRNVADMVAAARLANKSEIAFYLPPFGFRADAAMSVRAGILAAAQQRIVLAVRNYQLSERRRTKHCLTHDTVGLHAASVVRERDNIRRKLIHIRKLAARLAARYRAVRKHTDRCVALDYIQLLTQMRQAVRHGREIRHGTDGSVASVRACAAAGIYRLLVRKARLTKMYMYINKAG